MFNAAKLALAGAILAVIGGILVNTVSAPRPEHAPVQVGASPAPASSESPAPAASSESPSEPPSSSATTQDVEPGVVRVFKDSAGHDLDKGHPKNRLDTDGIAVGGDGTVWVLSTYHGSDNEAHPQAGWLVWGLDRPGIFGVKDGVPANASTDILATADGSLLLFRDGGIVEFDGSTFVSAAATTYPLAGGTLRAFSPSQQASQAAGASPQVGLPTDSFFMIDADGHWTSVEDWTRVVDLNGSFCMATYNGVQCGGDRFGAGRTYLSGKIVNHIAGAPDGSLWAVTGGDAGGGLYRITLP